MREGRNIEVPAGQCVVRLDEHGGGMDSVSSVVAVTRRGRMRLMRVGSADVPSLAGGEVRYWSFPTNEEIRLYPTPESAVTLEVVGERPAFDPAWVAVYRRALAAGRRAVGASS